MSEPFPAVRSGGTSAHIFFVNYVEVDIIRSLIGFWSIPQDTTQIPPNEKRASPDYHSLSSDRQGETVDMDMAGMADDENSG